MKITTTTRTVPKNWDCKKCGGHIWWDDRVEHIPRKRRRHWWTFTADCVDLCPDGEHMHRFDSCSRCGWSQRRVQAIEPEHPDGGTDG